MNENVEIAETKAGRREWIGMAVIALPCLLYSMDLTVLHLAVPRLTRDLAPSGLQLLWIIDIYGFMVAGSLIAAGTLGDRIGRRRLLLSGAALFAAASVLAAFSRSAAMLIATRALLGIAGATVAPSTLSLIRNMFHDPRERTTAVSIWIMSFSIGGAIGPLVGGALLQYFWWGSVFLIAVPVMALVLVLGPKLLPEYRDPNAGTPDVLSAALSLAAVLTMIFGLKKIAQDGIGILPVMTIGAGIAIGAAFVRRQRALPDPLIDLRLFRIPAFNASLAMYGITILVLFGGFFFLPQYLQLVRGLSPFEGGLWTVPWALAFVIGSFFTPTLGRRFDPFTVMAVGTAIAAIGYWMLSRINAASPLPLFAASTFIFAAGVSPVFTLTTDLIIGSAPAERAGAASAISETCAEFGGAIGIALFGSIGMAVYRGFLADAMPAGVAPDIAEAARATLAGAIGAAERSPIGVGTEVAAAARTAFVRALQVCALISAVASTALAFYAARTLRRIRPAGSAAE